jgi:hypothetical protein
MIELQVTALHEQGASAAEIAEQLNLPLQSVEYTLARVTKEDFSEDDAQQMAGVIKQIAFNGDNERTRLQAAMFGYEVKRGLRKKGSELPAVSITQPNQLIINAERNISNIVPNLTAEKARGTGAAYTAKGSNPPEVQHREAKPAGWEYEGS